MRTRFLLPLIALLCTVTLVACDSDPTVSRLEVDGAYAVTTWTFTPTATVLGPENVMARLELPATQLTLGSSSAAYVLNYKFLNAPGQFIISGGYTTEGNRVILDFGERNSDRRKVLLPPEVKFTYDEAAMTLSFDGTVRGINLQEFDPAKYGTDGTFTNVTGRLNIVFTRK